MALKKVTQFYVDDEGRLIADLAGGERIIVTEIRASNGKPPGENYQNHQGEGLPDIITMALTRVANRLMATQNNDGGWDWMNPNTNPSQGLPSPHNTLGVTAQGILDCYSKALMDQYLEPCKAAYRAMADYSQDPNPSKHRIRGPDITFLVELSECIVVPLYAGFAKNRWNSAVGEFGGGTAAGFAEFIRDARKGQNLKALISWDINLYIQGVLALHRYFPDDGFADQASAMVDVIHNSLYVPPVDFDINDDTKAEFWCGISGALEAFLVTSLNSAKADDLSSQLLGGQQDDGHFVGVNGGSDVQTTAYAAIALVKAGKDRAALSAVNYLISSQLTNGGWKYDGGENTEVASEAAQAICDYT